MNKKKPVEGTFLLNCLKADPLEIVKIEIKKGGKVVLSEAKLYEKDDYEEFKKDFGEGSEIHREADYLFSGVDDPVVKVLSRGAMGIPIEVKIIKTGNYCEMSEAPKPKNRFLEWIRGVFK